MGETTLGMYSQAYTDFVFLQRVDLHRKCPDLRERSLLHLLQGIDALGLLASEVPE